MNRATDQSFVRAVHDISQGGLAVSLAEMCITNGVGSEIRLPVTSTSLGVIDQLFSESNSRFLVEVQAGEEPKFEKLMKGIAYSEIGKVTESGIRMLDHEGNLLISASTEDCASAWKSGFSIPFAGK